MDKAVIIYSGGMDSFTLLNKVDQQGKYHLHALSFDYGQKHKKELIYAMQVTQDLMMNHKIVHMESIGLELMGGSSLTGGDDVPEGHYAEESMKATVVPNRNMILLSLAIGYAVSIGAKTLFYGAHSGDHAIYPDCRPEFVEAMNAVSEIANYQGVYICAPFMDATKGEILEYGRNIGLEYDKTWTCYNGREKACGKCGACVERLEAFEQNGIPDPLEYE